MVIPEALAKANMSESVRSAMSVTSED